MPADQVTPHAAPQQHAVSLPALWFGLFGAFAAWSLQTLINYALVAHACYPGFVPRAVPIIGGVSTIALGVSIITLLVALAASLTALSSWRATRSERGGRAERLLEVGDGRTRFMAAAGLILSGIFTLTIVLNGVPLFMLPTCS